MNNEFYPLNDIDDVISQINSNESFLLLGARGTGKTICGIRYALQQIESQKSIYLTSSNKDQIIEKVRMINSNPNRNFDENLLVYQSPAASLNNGSKINDGILVKILMGILNPIEKVKPQKVIFDEITPYLAFSDLDLLEKTIRKIISFLKYFNIKGLFTLAEPVSPRARIVTDLLKKEFMGFTVL